MMGGAVPSIGLLFFMRIAIVTAMHEKMHNRASKDEEERKEVG